MQADPNCPYADITDERMDQDIRERYGQVLALVNQTVAINCMPCKRDSFLRVFPRSRVQRQDDGRWTVHVHA
ncbi:hypothetical protein Thiowin_02348 [Thiorhodovibrio winogradskyi]|uniref:Uncharacterized protein n=1 Tax=Thiorhodovibrio winogradskyi TaxID=77007 RepID=A0ABZ0S9Y9_9GAMM|nr:hypothetical protein [Thiorhodovibrio winogradskyi]